MSSPLLSGLVVHWHNEDELERLAAAWPADPRFELVVVDNASSRACRLPPDAVLLRPDTNLGFAGGINLAAQVARAEILLLLNPDAEPLPGALEALLHGLAQNPRAAGLVPALLDPDGTPQAPWQARSIPTSEQLILQPWFGDRRRGPSRLTAGEQVEQPAAAALALRRDSFEAVAGLDPRYRPAWFEDVDLARRLADLDRPLVAWPAAEFCHARGASVPRLGYGRFLSAYHRNLERYLRRHAGPAALIAARVVLLTGLLLRLVSLLVRTPQRAQNRLEAAVGLSRTLLAAASGWRFGDPPLREPGA
jgi:GT2 family glycosyltransferase